MTPIALSRKEMRSVSQTVLLGCLPPIDPTVEAGIVLIEHPDKVAASIYWALSGAEGAIISLRAHEGISPELVGVLCHGLSCAPRARPASKAARI